MFVGSSMLQRPMTSPSLSAQQLRIHYHNPDVGMCTDDTKRLCHLYTWLDDVEYKRCPPQGRDDYGLYFDIEVPLNGQQLSFIINNAYAHSDDPRLHISLQPNQAGHSAPDTDQTDADSWDLWIIAGQPTVHCVRPLIGMALQGDLHRSKACWQRRDLILWPHPLPADCYEVRLHNAPQAGLQLETLPSSYSVVLEPSNASVSKDIARSFPHLANYQSLYVPTEVQHDAARWLRGQLAVTFWRADGSLLDASSVQIAGVLDDLYSYNGALGIRWQHDVPVLRLWAPTAKSVSLHLYQDSHSHQADVYPLDYDAVQGVWKIQGQADWKNCYYLYEVQVYVPSTQKIESTLVTDPYSLNLSTNSQRSQIIDLEDEALKPEGWDTLRKPDLPRIEDSVMYELHVRDFSVADDSVPEALRGTYLAFTQADSRGCQHLRALSEVGVSHVHLLPVADIATINEDRSQWPTLSNLHRHPPDSPAQQEAVGNVRQQDGYNWGYDPYHFMAPEGSYASDPAARVLEFRQMVKALAAMGLRVVMDVVYNHTFSSGLAATSVLDKVVPGYYHRLNADGYIESSTCCQNTASEHRMMEKLMIDSLRMWTTAYKLDGFRFDLMGHHMVANMLKIQASLRSLTLEHNGVDGSKLYLYGEGWDFGEVAMGARGVNASQFNVAGLGIGTFNDRLRDAVRGGDSFSNLRGQGFVTGLSDHQLSPEQQQERRGLLLHLADLVRIGMAGNLANYYLIDHMGHAVPSRQIYYQGAPTAYAATPRESVNYVSAHDNETLFDAIQSKASPETVLEERIRMQHLALAIVAFSQGIPFFHAGSELLRSKSLDRDSYDSGDWFNKIDWSAQSNNWGIGLPPAWSNAHNWNWMKPLLANPALKPSPEQLEHSLAYFKELLTIRKSSPLFRLDSSAEVRTRLKFYNVGSEQRPGLIVMQLLGQLGENINADPNYKQIVVLIHSHSQTQTFSSKAFEHTKLELHPVHRQSVDSRIKALRFEPSQGRFEIPGRTAAVLVEPLAE